MGGLGVVAGHASVGLQHVHIMCSCQPPLALNLNLLPLSLTPNHPPSMQELCGGLRQQPSHAAAPPRRILPQPPRPLHLRHRLQRRRAQPPGGRRLWGWFGRCVVMLHRCVTLLCSTWLPRFHNPAYHLWKHAPHLPLLFPPSTPPHPSTPGGCGRAGGRPRLVRPLRGQALQLPGQVRRAGRRAGLLSRAGGAGVKAA